MKKYKKLWALSPSRFWILSTCFCSALIPVPEIFLSERRCSRSCYLSWYCLSSSDVWCLYASFPCSRRWSLKFTFFLRYTRVAINRCGPTVAAASLCISATGLCCDWFRNIFFLRYTLSHDALILAVPIYDGPSKSNSNSMIDFLPCTSVLSQSGRSAQRKCTSFPCKTYQNVVYLKDIV